MVRITLVGNGNMALSLAQGLESHHTLEIVGRDIARLQAFSRYLKTPPTLTLIDKADISGKNVILCVKPVNLYDVSTQLKGEANILFSVLAGTPLEALSVIKAKSYIRAMPNVAATHLKSMTTVTGDIRFKHEALDLFDAIGTTLWVDSEKELDIATAVAGSGPAYLALVAEALMDGAVNQGLKRTDATALVRGLFAGFSPLIYNDHPAIVKDKVMSPAGTTAAGYAKLEEHGVRIGVINAIQAAFERTKK